MAIVTKTNLNAKSVKDDYIELHETVPVKIIADYRDKDYSGVLDLGTYTHVDDNKALAYFNERYDGNAKMEDLPAFCSCCIKPIETNGVKSTVFGRSMDLPNSYYPAYIFKIDEPGKYKTLNIGYTSSNMETFDQIAETSTMDKKMYDVLPYLVTDVINEHGLVMETNMRGALGEVNCPGTYPGKLRICELNLVRYLGDHCKDIDDVIKALWDLDIYTPNSSATHWHFAIAMMDKTGRFGVLEFVDNKAVWHEDHPGQCNFWIDKYAYYLSDGNIGLGRWKTLMENYEDIKSLKDMAKAMERIWYSQLFDKDIKDLAFDYTTEMTDSDISSFIDMGISFSKIYNFELDKNLLNEMYELQKELKEKPTRWSQSYVESPLNRRKVVTVYNFITYFIRRLPADGLKRSGLDEVSDISYVIDSKEQVVYMRFFEQDKVFELKI